MQNIILKCDGFFWFFYLIMCTLKLWSKCLTMAEIAENKFNPLKGEKLNPLENS